MAGPAAWVGNFFIRSPQPGNTTSSMQDLIWGSLQGDSNYTVPTNSFTRDILKRQGTGARAVPGWSHPGRFLSATRGFWQRPGLATSTMSWFRARGPIPSSETSLSGTSKDPIAVEMFHLFFNPRQFFAVREPGPPVNGDGKAVRENTIGASTGRPGSALGKHFF